MRERERETLLLLLNLDHYITFHINKQTNKQTAYIIAIFCLLSSLLSLALLSSLFSLTLFFTRKKMVSVLVLGANGYIGFNVSVALRRAGYLVYGVIRKKEAAHKLELNEIIPVIA